MNKYPQLVPPPKANCTLYLAGPMTDLPDMNHPAFHAEAARLRAMGYTVVSPAELVSDKTAKWIDCMCTDIPELIKCDGIALLPGWRASTGAILEHCIATALGKLVMECADTSAACHEEPIQALKSK